MLVITILPSFKGNGTDESMGRGISIGAGGEEGGVAGMEGACGVLVSISRSGLSDMGGEGLSLRPSAIGAEKSSGISIHSSD